MKKLFVIFVLIISAINTSAKTCYYLTKYSSKSDWKKLERENALNLMDFHARIYDPLLGRFISPDPLREKFPWISAYTYALNNPIFYRDIDGRDALISISENNIKISVNILLYGIGATNEIAETIQKNILDYWSVNHETGEKWTYTNNKNGKTYTIDFNVNVMLHNQDNPKAAPSIIQRRIINPNHNNYINMKDLGNTSRSFVAGGSEGTWNSNSRCNKSFKESDSSPHEFGHLIGFKDRYNKNGPMKGWNNNIMAESILKKPRVEQRNIDNMFNHLFNKYYIPYKQNNPTSNEYKTYIRFIKGAY